MWDSSFNLFALSGEGRSESLSGVISSATFIDTRSSSEANISSWQGEKVSGDLLGPVVGVLEELVFEAVTESNALISVDQEDVAGV